MRHLLPAGALGLAALLSQDVLAQAGEAVRLDPVTVTATRLPVPALEVPGAIGTVELDAMSGIDGALDVLQAVPGVSARNRQNYAQDAQISIRGFGTRSSFGIRGIRLYLDGIPATQPDGQGQISHLNLASAERIEILRGPFSTLYGNASGGVLQVFSRPIADAPAATASATVQLEERTFSALVEQHGLAAGLTVFETDGFRPHSAAQRTSLNLRGATTLVGDRKLTVIVNHLDAPDAQDPLGLTRAQLDENPRQTAVVATQFDTRKSLAQSQVGAILETGEVASGAWRAMAYGGGRVVEQYLAIPVATQANPRHPGGVVALDSQYGGGDLRYSRRLAGSTVTVGLAWDGLRQRRQGFENFVGTTLGVRGGLRRDEVNHIRTFDQYAQVQLPLSARWSLLAGARHGAVRFDSDDDYITAANPDDSGGTRYSAITPAIALSFRANDGLRAFVSYGTGFETPTAAELAYTASDGGGFNASLRDARSRTAEAGMKWQIARRSRVELTAFRTDTEDELVPIANSGGRSVFANASATRREGVEALAALGLAPKLDLLLAYTLLEAKVRTPYGTCVTTPCNGAQATVPAGARLAGSTPRQWFAELAYRFDPALQLALRGRGSGEVPADDLNRESAEGYAVADLELSGRYLRYGWRLAAENLADTRYVGSVIVNESNRRYYEPAPGQRLLLGVEARFGDR